MDNNNNYKIDFEEKFKDENFNENEVSLLEPNKDNSVFSILIYVILFFLGGAALLVGIFFKEPTNDYLVLESFELYDNENLIAYMLKESYNKEKDRFDLDDYVYEFNDVNYILITKHKEESFIHNNYKDIINGSVNKWNDNEEAENIYIIAGVNSEGFSLLKDNENINLIKVTVGYSIAQNGVIMFLAYLIVSIPLIYINRNKLMHDLNMFIQNETKPALGNLAYSFATMFAVSIGLGILSNILIQLFNFKSDSVNQESIMLMLKSKSFILIAITTVFIGPLVEELIFRKSIFGIIKNNNVAIAISGISFGLIHIISELLSLVGQINLYSLSEVIVTSIPYVGMGIAFSILYVKNNKNVFLLYLVHALLNLLSILTIFIQ